MILDNHDAYDDSNVFSLSLVFKNPNNPVCRFKITSLTEVAAGPLTIIKDDHDEVNDDLDDHTAKDAKMQAGVQSLGGHIKMIAHIFKSPINISPS